MSRTRLLTTLCILASSAGLPGCFHPYRTANVMVLHATSGRPFPNVEVGTRYHTKIDPFAPSTSTGITGPDGRVTLRIAPYHTGKHFYAKVGEQYAFLDVKATEFKRLPRWWPWSRIVNHSSEPVDFIIDASTDTGKALELPPNELILPPNN